METNFVLLAMSLSIKNYTTLERHAVGVNNNTTKRQTAAQGRRGRASWQCSWQANRQNDTKGGLGRAGPD